MHLHRADSERNPNMKGFWYYQCDLVYSIILINEINISPTDIWCDNRASMLSVLFFVFLTAHILSVIQWKEWGVFISGTNIEKRKKETILAIIANQSSNSLHF